MKIDEVIPTEEGRSAGTHVRDYAIGRSGMQQ